jgi:DNA-binding response OmpR family regulator
VLVVEDEADIATSIADRLRAEGYNTLISYNGQDALNRVDRVQPDLIILDIMLPKVDGLEVARQIRASKYIPILMLTARDDEVDILQGFSIGADDYMTKPFSMRELMARVKALLRRASIPPAPSAEPLIFGDLSIDEQKYTVTKNGKLIHFTPTEFQLLISFVKQPNIVLTRDKLLAEIWDWEGAEGATRTVDSHIKTLRQKIGSDFIKTSHGFGYFFDEEGMKNEEK